MLLIPLGLRASPELYHLKKKNELECLEIVTQILNLNSESKNASNNSASASFSSSIGRP